MIIKNKNLLHYILLLFELFDSWFLLLNENNENKSFVRLNSGKKIYQQMRKEFAKKIISLPMEKSVINATMKNWEYLDVKVNVVFLLKDILVFYVKVNAKMDI